MNLPVEPPGTAPRPLPAEPAPADGQVETAPEEPSSGPPAGRPRRRFGLDLAFPLTVLLIVGTLSLFGISGSSVSIYSGDGRPDERALLVGEPRALRSDEWLVATPLKVGQVRAGFPFTRVMGLGDEPVGDAWRTMLPARNIGAALFAPFNLPLVLLPLTQGFALSFWLPFLLACLGTWAWLRALGVGRGPACAAGLAVALAPAFAWWSGWPGYSIGLATMSAALLVVAVRCVGTRPWLSVATAAAGLLVSLGLPWYYPPWSVPVAWFVGTVTLGWVASDRGRRRPALVVLVPVGLLAAAAHAAYFLHEREYLEALANTVYPGARWDAGGGGRVGQVFSSSFPFVSVTELEELQGTNASELSTGWGIALVAGLCIVVLGRRVVWASRERWTLVVAAAAGAFLTSWCFVRWPRPIPDLTVLRVATANRMAPMVGFFGVVLLALLLATATRRAALRRELGASGLAVVFAVVGFVTVWAGTELRAAVLPSLPGWRVWLAAIVGTLLVTLLVTRRPHLGVVPILGVAAVSFAVVNPLTQGLGSLVDSEAAETVAAVDAASVAPVGGRWAVDDLFNVGLVNGQGVQSLSSLNDPVHPDAWRVLDPSGASEDLWNRYAYILFDPTPGHPEPTFATVGNDIVIVTVDPCDPALDELRLTAIVSRERLPSECLAEVAEFSWMGTPDFVYLRSRVP